MDVDAQRKLKLLGVEVVLEPGGAAIRQSWSRSSGIAVLVTFVFFGLFLLIVGLATGMFRAFGTFIAGPSGWAVGAVLAPVALALLLVLYVAICNLRNVATWRVEEGRLTGRHGPVPGRKSVV